MKRWCSWPLVTLFTTSGCISHDKVGDSADSIDTTPDDTAPDDTVPDDTAPHDTSSTVQYWTSDPDGFVQVAASEYHRCALSSSGEVQCWGSSRFGKTDVPAGTYAQISVGRWSSCAISTDGVPVCWGCGHDDMYSADEGQCSVGTGTAAQIGAGDFFTVTLDPSGSLQLWSDSTSEQLLGISEDELPSGVVSVDVGTDPGSRWLCTLDTAGAASCWSYPELSSAYPHDEPGPFTEIRTGIEQVCAGTAEGEWTCWHDGGGETLAPGTYIDVDAGPYASCGILPDGSILCAGALAAIAPPEGAFTQIAVGQLYACAIRDDGAVACWGDLDEVEQYTSET